MASAYAPSRSFGGLSNPRSTNGVPVRPAQIAKPALVDLPALQNASRVLQDQFAKDAQIIPDLGDTLTARMCSYNLSDDSISTRAAGGPVSASYSVFPDDIRVPFQKRKFVSIPDGLFQYYDSRSSFIPSG